MTTATLTANDQHVELPLDGTQGTVTAMISGNWYGTVIFEGRMDSVWVGITGMVVGSGFSKSCVNAVEYRNSRWLFNAVGLSAIRIRANALIQGSVTVSMRSLDTDVMILALHAAKALLDFGPAIARNTDVRTVIEGQSGIVSDSIPRAWILGATLDNDADAHTIASDLVQLSCGDIVPGTGFTIHGLSNGDVTGKLSVAYQWS